MTSAGAAPNETMSARLSYSAPKSLCVLVIRATRPSRLSSTIDAKIASTAESKRRFIACTIAKKPLNRAAVVNAFGSR